MYIKWSPTTVFSCVHVEWSQRPGGGEEKQRNSSMYVNLSPVLAAYACSVHGACQSHHTWLVGNCASMHTAYYISDYIQQNTTYNLLFTRLQWKWQVPGVGPKKGDINLFRVCGRHTHGEKSLRKTSFEENRGEKKSQIKTGTPLKEGSMFWVGG